MKHFIVTGLAVLGYLAGSAQTPQSAVTSKKTVNGKVQTTRSVSKRPHAWKSFEDTTRNVTRWWMRDLPEDKEATLEYDAGTMTLTLEEHFDHLNIEGQRLTLKINAKDTMHCQITVSRFGMYNEDILSERKVRVTSLRQARNNADQIAAQFDGLYDEGWYDPKIMPGNDEKKAVATGPR